MARRTYKTEEAEASKHVPGGARQEPTRPDVGLVMNLQRQAGNSAVSQALTVQRLWNRTGKTLRPYRVNNGTGPGQNLKWNKGSRGVGGKKQYNTGFWCLSDDYEDQLHVHMGDAGGLTQAGGAHHWKRGTTYGATASESDLETVFGSKNVLNWTKQSYTIP